LQVETCYIHCQIVKSLLRPDTTMFRCSMRVQHNIRGAESSEFGIPDFEYQGIVFGSRSVPYVPDSGFIGDFDFPNGSKNHSASYLAPLSSHHADRVVLYTIELFNRHGGHTAKDGRARILGDYDHETAMGAISEACSIVYEGVNDRDKPACCHSDCVVRLDPRNMPDTLGKPEQEGSLPVKFFAHVNLYDLEGNLNSGWSVISLGSNHGIVRWVPPNGYVLPVETSKGIRAWDGDGFPLRTTDDEDAAASGWKNMIGHKGGREYGIPEFRVGEQDWVYAMETGLSNDFGLSIGATCSPGYQNRGTFMRTSSLPSRIVMNIRNDRIARGYADILAEIDATEPWNPRRARQSA
jgi:hypothetical protein